MIKKILIVIGILAVCFVAYILIASKTLQKAELAGIISYNE